MPQWNLIQSLDEIGKVQVFSGGASNIVDAEGKLVRNVERDEINNWLTKQGLHFYDPQIHPSTHGREYDYEVDHKLEVACRRESLINIYEMSPRTFGGVTSMEIAIDEFRFEQPTIIFFSDGKQNRDVIPVHSKEGYPLFEPYGIGKNEAATRTHYKEMIKNANRMRKYLMLFAVELQALSVTFGKEAYEGDVVITPHRMHAAEIFEALVKAASGERVMVNFTGGEAAVDKHGNPIYIAPENPRPIQMISLLDQYVDDGNALRKAISELVKINVFSRVVYTQRAAVNALIDLLRVKGLGSK